jgi:hypothetical protein
MGLITADTSPARSAVASAGALVVAAAQPAPAHLLAGRAVAIAAAALAGVTAAGAHVGTLALAAHVCVTCGQTGGRRHSIHAAGWRSTVDSYEV